MISAKITRNHSTGRAASANIGRDSRLFGWTPFWPYLPINVPPNSPLHYDGVILNNGYLELVAILVSEFVNP